MSACVVPLLVSVPWGSSTDVASPKVSYPVYVIGVCCVAVLLAVVGL